MVTADTKRNRIRNTGEDRVFYIFVFVILGFLFLVVLYPMIYVISSSFSSPWAVSTGRVVLWPVDLSLEGYKAVFTNNMIGIGYMNTVIYTICGTLINVFMTVLAAYPLACPRLPGKKIFMFLFTFTMLFSGGMIPSYILIRTLGMLNTRWAMVIPGAIGVYEMIITRTFFMSSIPAELQEAAEIDGASDIQYMLHCVLPLSKAVLAVITLYFAVGHWNAYFNAFLYLTNKNLFPLQIVLRDILLSNMIDPTVTMDETLLAAKLGMADLLKYALIIVSSLPVMMIYPFIQKYFIQGVMIGSLKG
ncbi:MAG: carbohydrate ABC transporter permease [Treponema sp.]|nr:carbohydrate ABC transporter permease [Treponema sp.]